MARTGFAAAHPHPPRRREDRQRRLHRSDRRSSGSDIGVHTRADDNEEIYVVVSGTATMRVDDRIITVSPVDVVANRPGGTHGLWNAGDEEVRPVVIEVPRGGSGRTVP